MEKAIFKKLFLCIVNMKFSTDNTFDNPITIDGTSLATITFEVGDIFVDVNNKYKKIANISTINITFIDEFNSVSFAHNPLNKEFIEKYRYAGAVNDDTLPEYKDALPLS